MELLISFSIIAIGWIVGKIKIKNISLDLSAILIIAIFFGFLASVFRPQLVDLDLQNCMEAFSMLGTAVFVSTIGLSTGNSSSNIFQKKNLGAFAIGVLIVAIDFVLVFIISTLDYETNKSVLSGILCGALTSTPGLSSVCENALISSEGAAVGYGCAYIFGVVSIVVTTQILAKIGYKGSCATESVFKTSQSCKDFSFILISISIVIGSIINIASSVCFSVSLGSTGCILISSLVIGYLTGKKKIALSEQNTKNFRILGISLFFVGRGFLAGLNLNTELSLVYIAYGVLLSLAPIGLGIVLCKYVFKYEIANSAYILAGGMTSTPALNVLLEKEHSPKGSQYYSMAYIGALLTIIILSNNINYII